MPSLNNITNNIANSTITRNTAGQSLSSGRYYAYVDITANDGYKFADSGNYTVNGGDYSITYNNTRTVATFYVYGYNGYNAAISFSGVLEQLTPAPQITNNINDTAETHTFQNNILTVTVTGSNANYRFTTAPTFTYTDTDGNEKTVNLSVSVSSGISTATATITDFDVTKTAQINGVYEKVILVSTNLQNSEISPNFEYYTASGTQSFTITAANGYQFDTAPTATFTINGTYSQSSLTVAANKLTATITINLAQSGLTSIEFYARPETTEKTVQITRNLANCATNAPQSISENDTEININCTANNGFTFESAPTIMFYDANDVVLHGFTFNVLQSKLSANVTFDVSQFDDFADVETIVLTAAAVHVPQTIELVTTAVNCVTDAPQYVNESDTQITITATANANCEFDTAPILTIRLKNSSYQSVTFTIAQNKLTAVGTLNVTQIGFANIDTLSLYAAAEVVTPQFEKYGTINVYKVTTNNLADFAAQRFISYGSNDTANVLDLGNYVNSIKRLYINVGDCVNNVLKCGNHNTNIAVETPLNDIITVNCGTVAIPTPNNSNTDYNSEITLFLPFIGLVVISSDFVGKTLNLAYKCNIIKGDAIAEITVNDVIILQYECNISYDVIYKTLQTQTAFNTVGSVDFNTQILRGLQPYAVLKYYTDKNAQLFNSDCVRVSLSEINGYFAAKEIENFISDTITETETEILINEIANGVFILAV